MAQQDYPGASRTTLDLLQWWRRDGRERPLFFAQLEAAETIIFLVESRADFRQGLNIPREELGPDKLGQGCRSFLRYACKMATGTGKTTVMGMIAAWSILNKVNNRGDARFSDVVLVVCPNVTIRNRLAELDPAAGAASIYYTRDLVPPDMRTDLTRGRVLVTNWHVFEPRSTQTGGTSAKVNKAGVPLRTREKITIGPKTTTARGSRYLTQEDFDRQVAAGLLTVLEEEHDKHGTLKKVFVESVRYVESDTSLINRVLGREVGGKQNILVMNDEAHHAYRIRREEPDEDQGDSSARTRTRRSSSRRRRSGSTGWTASTSCGASISAWTCRRPRITWARRPGHEPPLSVGGQRLRPDRRHRVGPDQDSATCRARHNRRGDPRLLQYLALDSAPTHPGRARRQEGQSQARSDPEVCQSPDRDVGRAVGEGRWRSGAKSQRRPAPARVYPGVQEHGDRQSDLRVAGGGPAADRHSAREDRGLPQQRRRNYTIRVDSKVVQETDDLEGSKGDENRWMRLTLDTVGKTEWPKDQMGRDVYPEGFEELAKKMDRPLSPPGRDVRCIVSVGMLTEGWDCNTVTHIIGLRPFMSQLLCEQVVGRGLRRRPTSLTRTGSSARKWRRSSACHLR